MTANSAIAGPRQYKIWIHNVLCKLDSVERFKMFFHQKTPRESVIKVKFHLILLVYFLWICLTNILFNFDLPVEVLKVLKKCLMSEKLQIIKPGNLCLRTTFLLSERKPWNSFHVKLDFKETFAFLLTMWHWPSTIGTYEVGWTGLSLEMMIGVACL